MKYCTNCGNEVNEDAVICVTCGTALKKSSGSGSGSIDNSTTLAIVGLILCFIFWPVGLGLSIYSYTKTQDNKDTNEYKLSLAGIIVGGIMAVWNLGSFFFMFF